MCCLFPFFLAANDRPATSFLFLACFAQAELSFGMKKYYPKGTRACFVVVCLLWAFWSLCIFLRPRGIRQSISPTNSFNILSSSDPGHALASSAQSRKSVIEGVKDTVAIASKLVAYQKNSHGAEINVAPCVTKSAIRGGCATKDLEPGDTVVKIPRKALWSYENLMAGEVGQGFKDLVHMLGREKMSTFCPLAAYHLLHERDLGEISRWSPYIPFLASSPNDTALLWSRKRNIQELGSELIAVVEREKSKIAGIWRIVNPVICRKVPSLEKYSFHEYLWAYTKCKSRAWGSVLFGEPFMVPGAADILNTDVDGSVVATVDDEGNFIMKANMVFRKGQEVTFWYEEPRKVDQLISYGFLPKNWEATHYAE